MSRILTALVGAPILFLVIKYLRPEGYLVLVAAAVILACRELFALADRQGMQPHRALGTALAVAAAWSFALPRLSPVAILGVAAMLIPLASLARARNGGRSLEGAFHDISATLFAILLPGLLMGFTVGLLGSGEERGRDLIVLLFWTVWMADAGAWAIGTLWGRHKLIPAVSPGKSVEGAMGAIAFSLLATLAAKLWFFRSLGTVDAIALGLLLGVAGMLGDLVESLLKRSAATKDSGGLFPGHGGMLDRTDSLMFAAPVLFYYHRFFLS